MGPPVSRVLAVVANDLGLSRDGAKRLLAECAGATTFDELPKWVRDVYKLAVGDSRDGVEL